MNITHLKNGNLEMSADVNEQDEIKEYLNDKTWNQTMLNKEASWIIDYLSGDPMGDGKSYEQVAPEEVGALTSAPIISDGENVYGYMDYAIKSFLEELANGETITWQKG
jgi:hypothetical protein